MIQCSFWDCFVQLSAWPAVPVELLLGRDEHLLGNVDCLMFCRVLRQTAFSFYCDVGAEGSRAAGRVDVAFSQLLY